MAKLAVLAVLLYSASALVLEEDIHPLREVGPDEFHRLALIEAKPRNLKVQPKTQGQNQEEKKMETEKAKRQAKNKAQREQESVLVDSLKVAQQKEEELIVASHKERSLKVSVGPINNKKEPTKQWPWDALQQKTQEEAEQKAAPTVSFKANKTLACTNGNKEILSIYISQMGGGQSTRSFLNRERCMRAQLDQHCMPYESFAATLVEPCDTGDWTCANKRVLNDHANCLTKSVDWEAMQNYAKESGKTMWDLLGSWCSHVKLLKEVSNRMQLDEKFANDYPAPLVLQDHVILDKEWTEEIAKDWVNNYDGQWDLVQLDAKGKGLKRDLLRDFRGKPVYKPSWKGQYTGFHAVLLNTKSVPTLLEKMQSLNVVPVEWLTKSMNDQPQGLSVLSWDAGISTTATEGTFLLKETWMPNVPACADARKHKTEY